jgi:signal transduction histidine kinase
MAVCGITAAAVVGPDGIVLASTDPAWAAAGSPAAALPAPAGGVATRALALAGRPSDWGEPFVLDVVDRVTVGAYPLVADDGRLVGVLVGRGAQLSPIGNASVREFLWGLLRSNLYVLPLFALPGLLVGIPVGIWRARVLGRRLARLAAAADAVAGGDLGRRVAVGRPDEIGRLGGRFNELAAALAASDAARRRFMADVSHDLRTPIAIVQGNLERLLGDDAPPTDAGNGSGAAPGATMVGAPEAADGASAAGVPAAASGPGPASGPRAAPERVDQTAALRVMHRETLTLGRLIDDLFTLARLEETSLPVEPVALRLDRVAAEAVVGVRSVAWGARKVEVRSLVRPELPAVLADPTRLRQIFGNLLHNALRHTPEGGVIVVDAALVGPEPGGAPEGDGPRVEVSVADTGVGIPPAELDAVFDRFFQVGGGRTGGGAGLGLHIVRQLVEAQRGTIRVESRPGEGTVFRFTLPTA